MQPRSNISASVPPATSPAAARRPAKDSVQWLFQNVVWLWLAALVIVFSLVEPDASRALRVTVKRPLPRKRVAGSQCRV